jgi:hypothetical protein
VPINFSRRKSAGSGWDRDTCIDCVFSLFTMNISFF